jgi:hypothetical protein
MKRVVICALLLGGMLTAAAQVDKEKLKTNNPKSPYAETSVTVNGKGLWIAYHAPSVRGRTIFGGAKALQPDDSVWRLGADYVTILHTDATLDLNGLSVPAGEYALYMFLDKGKWQLIVNKQVMNAQGARVQWGINMTMGGGGDTSEDPAKDLGRVAMTMGKPPALIETLKISLSASDTKGNIDIAWENVTASVPFSVK